MSFFEQNIKLLANKNPGLAQKVINHPGGNVEIFITETQQYNLKYLDRTIHDIKNPELEAEIIFGEKTEETNNLYAVYGLGLGYLFNHTYNNSKGFIVLIEPSLDILKFTLENVDLSNHLADNRVFVIHELSELIDVFSKYIYSQINILFLNSYKDLYPKIHEKLILELNNRNVDQLTNINQSEDMARAFVDNIDNIFKYVSMEHLSNLAQDKAVLVASAGPSLDNAIGLIKKNREKFVIIAIGQTTKVFKEANIIPDFIVMSDRYRIRFQLYSLGEDINKVNLVLQPTAHSYLYDIETQSKFYYLPKDDFMAEWLAKRANIKTFPQGNTVSLQGLVLARLIGGNPIVLVGHDLAYTEGKIYADNTTLDSIKVDINQNGEAKVYIDDSKLANNIPDDGIDSEHKKVCIDHIHKTFENIVKVKGQKGEDLYTRNSYAAFIPQYAELVSNMKAISPDLRIINSSEGGAYLEGCEHKSLLDFINELPELEENYSEKIKQIYLDNKKTPEEYDKLKIHFNNLSIDLKNLKTDALKLQKAFNQFKKELKISKTLTNKVQNSAIKVQKLENKLKDYNKEDRLTFIYPFIQKELFEYNQLNDKVSSNQLEQLNNKLLAMNKFAECMITAADRFFKYYNKTIYI